MANLISLAFDAQLVIVRNLNLKDCLYSQLSTVCHVVYCVFSHWTDLDFSSVLMDDQYISLSDSLFIEVLHAHTRVTTIRNFSISRSFVAFPAFIHYLNLNICDSDQQYPIMILSLAHMLDIPKDNSRPLFRTFWCSHFRGRRSNETNNGIV